MATPSQSLQRWLARGCLRSFDEEDLMALTEAIVLEVAGRRSRDQRLLCDELASHTWAAKPPIQHAVVLKTLEQEVEDEAAEIQRLLRHPVEPQEE